MRGQPALVAHRERHVAQVGDDDHPDQHVGRQHRRRRADRQHRQQRRRPTRRHRHRVHLAHRDLADHQDRRPGDPDAQKQRGRPPAVAELQLESDQADHRHRAGRRRHADEELVGVGGLAAVVQQRVEPGQPQHHAHRVEQDRHPPGRRRGQQRHVEHDRRGHPEVHRVGQRVDLLAHPGLSVQDPRHPAVQPVQDRGRRDQRHRGLGLVLEGEPDRGQPRAHREHRHRAGQDLQIDCPAAARLADHGSSASTVSPAMARWPTVTSGCAPAGR
ncbi:hypothetical protein O972_22800 [Mycobacterium avium subsp. avium 10-9275]|nr:hypothetical protein O972_22800 [Mycobacterium avium subsp. avium 10-9275]